MLCFFCVQPTLGCSSISRESCKIISIVTYVPASARRKGFHWSSFLRAFWAGVSLGLEFPSGKLGREDWGGSASEGATSCLVGVVAVETHGDLDGVATGESTWVLVRLTGLPSTLGPSSSESEMLDFIRLD